MEPNIICRQGNEGYWERNAFIHILLLIYITVYDYVTEATSRVERICASSGSSSPCSCGRSEGIGIPKDSERDGCCSAFSYCLGATCNTNIVNNWIDRLIFCKTAPSPLTHLKQGGQMWEHKTNIFFMYKI